ncbi:MAG: PQQ-dependent sugar dehydrogenase [Planctomycetota bacterium]
MRSSALLPSISTLVLLALVTALSSHAEDKPTRVPWTTSHVNGSPEPPSPFETRRTFSKLTFDRPLDIDLMPGTNRIVVAEQKGKLFSFPNDPNIERADLFWDSKQVLNLDKITGCTGTDDTLAFTFHPRFQENRYVFIEYNLAYGKRARNHENGSRVSRFTVTKDDPPRVDPKSEVIFLQWLSGGHNGCALKFGPDGFLYISLGDAADPNPPDEFHSGQNISDLLCSVLRIDVDHPGANAPYSIPPDNPFIKYPGARPEVYAYGFRNPFRMNFDSKTGNLWVGDVGWELWEMIYCVKPAGNYGWPIMEGPNVVYPNEKRGPTEISKPQASVFHSESASITGGLVYRGTKFPEMVGHYIFGDWQTRKLWEAKCIGPKEDDLEPFKEIAQTDQRIVAFIEDNDHELIIVDHAGGGLYRLERNPTAGQPATFPRKLSATGLFASVKNQQPAAGVLPFAINAAQWVDGATAERFVALPGSSVMSWGKGVWGDKKPSWPLDSVLVRTLSLEKKVGDPATKKQIETQLLHFDGRQWHGYSYAWNDDQSDAELVNAAGGEKAIDITDASAPGGTRRQTWRFPSRTQCMTCHNVWCDYTLAFNHAQLEGASTTVDQVKFFKSAGMLLDAKPNDSKEKLTLTNPYDEKADLYERARSYLHINCSHCHRFGGGGAALFDFRKELGVDKLKAIDVAPALGDFGLDDGKLICGGDANRSVILYRMSKLGRGRMPQIESERIDEKGTLLLRQWITGLKTDPAEANVFHPSSQNRQFLSTLERPGGSSAAAANQLLATPSGAMLLLDEIQSGKLIQSNRTITLEKALASPNENVRDLFRQYDPKEQFIVRLGTNIDRVKLAAMPGDATRGRAVFDSASTAAAGATGLCASCHRVNGQGKDFGPDLSHIATKYTKSLLLENILEPSKTIAEGFALQMLKKKDGERITGLLVSKSDKEIVLRDQQKEHRIPAADVDKLTPQPTSAMPEGLLSNLTAQEAADLIEYLSTLK